MPEFFRNLIEHIRLFIVIIIAALILNYILVVRDFRPVYISNAALFVGMSPQEEQEVDTYELLQSVQISEKLVFDIPEVIYGSAVLNAVNMEIERENPDFIPVSLLDFKDFVSTEIVSNTRVVNITVEAYNPKEAQTIASIITQTTDLEVGRIMKQDYIHVIKEADFALKPTGITKSTLLVLSVIGGMLLGFLAILIITVTEKYNQ